MGTSRAFKRRDCLQRALAIAAVMGSSGAAWSAPGHGFALAKILMGAPAGGSGDLMARRVAEKLRGSYADAVIVENKPGAGGQLAVQALRDAPDDGSVMLLTPSSLLSIYPFTYKSLPYKPDSDLAPVSLAGYANMALAVGPAVPPKVRTLKDFLAWAQANPGAASYGSPASGSIPHLLMVVVAQRSGVPLVHIAYRGSSNALTDLRGGSLAALSAPLGAFLPHMKTGQLRLLAVSGDARSSFAPEVPTFRESGFELTAREWYGFFLPGRAGKEAIAKAAAAVRGVLAQPDLVEAMTQFGLQAASSTPAELAAMIKADREEWRALIKQIGFTAES